VARPTRSRRSPRPSASRRSLPPLGALLVLTCLALYWRVLGHRFTVDSAAIIQADSRVRDFDLHALLTTEYWNAKEGVERLEAKPGLYRPLTLLWLSTLARLTPDAQLRAATSVPINAGNIILHALGVVLRFLLIRELLGDRRRADLWAFVGALALALHPVSSEVVATQVGASDGLATVLSSASLLAFLAWLGGRRSMLVLHVVLLLLGLLAKESAMAVVPITAVLACLHGRRSLLASLGCALPSALCAASWMAWRFALFGTATGVSEPVYADFPAWARVATALAALVAYDLPALAWPTRLLPLVSFQDVVPAQGFGDARTLAALALGVAFVLALVLSWRRDRAVTCGIAIFALALAPLSNVAISIGALAATRFLYLPLTGLGLVLAACASHLFASPRGWVRVSSTIGVLGILAAHAVLTSREIRTWRDDASIHGAAWRRSPSSWSALSYGNDLERLGRPAEAMEIYARGAAFDRPKIPGRDRIPEDLLDASFQCAMNAAALQGQWAHDMVAAQHSLEIAVDISARGLAQSHDGFGVTDWRAGGAAALVELAQAEWATADGDASRVEAARAGARARLAAARALVPEDLLRERLELELSPRSPAGAAEALRALRAEAHERLETDAYAAQIVLEEARALRSAGDARSALRMEVEAATRARRYILDPGVLHDIGMQALADEDPALREEGRGLLREFLERMAASPGDPRVGEVELALSR